jgi:hypothetical protein
MTVRGSLPRAAWLTPHPELRGVFVGAVTMWPHTSTTSQVAQTEVPDDQR